VDSAERYFKKSEWEQFDDNEREQLEVLMEAFVLFQAREQKYQSLWQQYGAVDSYHHMKSKTARCQFYLEGVTDDESDPLDLINYSAFLIRNMRAGRIKNSVDERGPLLGVALEAIPAGSNVELDLDTGKVKIWEGPRG
jgi:hypothetical protein